MFYVLCLNIVLEMQLMPIWRDNWHQGVVFGVYIRAYCRQLNQWH